jgi:gas vesicle protein
MGRYKSRNQRNQFMSFLVGGVIGSAAAIIFAPASGRETRNNISEGTNRFLIKANDQKNNLIREAQKVAGDVVGQAKNIYKDSIEFAAGRYNSSAHMIELEIQGIRRALKAAVAAYKNKSNGGNPNPLANEVVVNEMFTDFENEKLPKSEGMGRRES